MQPPPQDTCGLLSCPLPSCWPVSCRSDAVGRAHGVGAGTPHAHARRRRTAAQASRHPSRLCCAPAPRTAQPQQHGAPCRRALAHGPAPSGPSMRCAAAAACALAPRATRGRRAPPRVALLFLLPLRTDGAAGDLLRDRAASN